MYDNLCLSESNEKNVFTMAYHKDVHNIEDAEKKLAGKAPGTFLTFSADNQNFCSAVGKNGKIRHNGFRWDVAGGWRNYSPAFYETETDLLDHLVDGQIPSILENS